MKAGMVNEDVLEGRHVLKCRPVSRVWMFGALNTFKKHDAFEPVPRSHPEGQCEFAPTKALPVFWQIQAKPQPRGAF